MELLGEDCKPDKETQEATEAAKPQNQEIQLQVDLTRQGWMTLHMNLEAVSHNQGMIDQFIGFMERNKQYGLQLIAMVVRNREALKHTVLNNGNKSVFRNFINKIHRGR